MKVDKKVNSALVEAARKRAAEGVIVRPRAGRPLTVRGPLPDSPALAPLRSSPASPAVTGAAPQGLPGALPVPSSVPIPSSLIPPGRLRTPATLPRKAPLPPNSPFSPASLPVARPKVRVEPAPWNGVAATVTTVRVVDGSPVATTYSFSAIARGSGYSLSHISRIFSGERVPSLRLLNLMSSLLGLSLDDTNGVIQDIQEQVRNGALRNKTKAS